ncbi:hypothetical protein ACIPY6_43745 [Streptomyces sp. NPDC090054]|uniref:hypothetical protein n=1 Tax=Streptomyces sp. NPDC090054 TaxID=3365933 RepID=UPI0037F24797
MTNGPAPVTELRVPVWHALVNRAGVLRHVLPPCPEDVPGRFAWWRSLSSAQARDAALLDRLDALCGHLAGRPAPGYAADDPLPDAALEEADGFLDAELAERAAAYRLRRGPDVTRRPPERPASAR